MAERMSMETVLADKWTTLKAVAGFESGEDLMFDFNDPDLVQKVYAKIKELNQPNRANYELVDLIWFIKNALNIASDNNLFTSERERERLASSIDKGRELTVLKYVAKIREQSPILIGASRSKAVLLRAVQRIPSMKSTLNAHAFDPERRRIKYNLLKLQSVYARMCEHN